MTGDVPPQPFLDLRRPRIAQRVIAAELLRRAFLALSEPPTWTPKSIHGTFGPTSGWQEYRAAISRLASPVTGGLRRSSAGSPRSPASSEAQIGELERWAREDLPSGHRATRWAQWATEEGELSELLATAGILPMFGFPTRARNLYDALGPLAARPGAELSSPTGRWTWRCQRSPPGRRSSATGLLHTAVGFAHYEIKGKDAYPADPLGPAHPGWRHAASA